MRSGHLPLLLACGLASCCASDALSWPPRIAPSLPAVGTAKPTSEGQAATESVLETPDGAVVVRPAWNWLRRLGGEPYALDDVTRTLDTKASARCNPSGLERYKGTSVRYANSVLVAPAFVARLTRFEALVNRVSLEVYGRKPSRLLHAGAYSCRASRNRSTRLSEHALGNALDVVGFSFPAATRAQRQADPTVIAGAFKVTISQHWDATRSPLGQQHRRFLRALADEVVDEDVFRVVLGPSHPGHADHLHFDMAPWNYTHL